MAQKLLQVFLSSISGTVTVITALRLFAGNYFGCLTTWVQKIIRTWPYIIHTLENVGAVHKWLHVVMKNWDIKTEVFHVRIKNVCCPPREGYPVRIFNRPHCYLWHTRSAKFHWPSTEVLFGMHLPFMVINFFHATEPCALAWWIYSMVIYCACAGKYNYQKAGFIKKQVHDLLALVNCYPEKSS